MITHPILQVEDGEEDAFFVQHAFKQAGNSTPIQLVTDGQSAIEYLSGTGKYADRGKFPLPCMVLLDLRLPLKRGLDVLAWIRQQAPSLRSMIVIIFTSSVTEADIRRAYELGANAFLVKPKPSEMKDLTEMCRVVHDFWIVHNTPPQFYLGE